MSDTLLIHYHPLNPSLASWALCNEQGELTSRISTTPLAEITDISTTHHTVMLLNSSCLHINRVALPTQNRQKMLRAIPYALEDYIADDVENFHFVITTDRLQHKTAVVGIKKRTLQTIIDNFNNTGITIDTIIPDVLCLAGDNKQWVILQHDENCYFQSGHYYGAVFNPELIPYVLQTSLTQDNTETPEKILVFTPNKKDHQQTDDALLENIHKITHQPDSTDKEPTIEILPIVYNEHPLVVFCGFYKQVLPLNLRQGKFKTRRQNNKNWQYWRLTTIFASIWLVLHLGLSFFQYNQLKQKNRATHNLIRQTYQTAFPASKRIVNPRVQMEQKLKILKSTGNSQNGLLFLLKQSFGTLTGYKKNITLQSLNYRNRRMDVGFETKNLETIENLNRQLNLNHKIKASIISSSAEKNQVKGNLRIEAGG